MSVGAVNKQTGDRIPTAGMPAIDDALDLTSVNPVQNAIITAALANKQDKTDNSLQTTDKTVVGAINEHEGDIDSLRSGLTNYQTQNDLNLEVPNRKNLFDPNSNLQLGFSNSIGTSGTFTSGSYYAYVVTKRSVPTFTISGVDYTKIEDTSIRVFVSSSYPAVGAAQWRTSNISDLSSKTVTLSENDKYLTFLIKWEDTATQADKESIMVEEGDTATTFAPYIPSVESRIEAVESVVTSYTLTSATDITINRASCVKIDNTVIVDAVVTFGADKSASSALLYGIPAIGNTNIPIYAVDDNATARPVRLYNNGVFTSGAFTASEKIHIMGSYTLTN